jgi:hypothetical protein
MKIIMFFAVKDDLVPVLDAVESVKKLRYVEMGQFQDWNYRSFPSAAEIPNLSTASADSAINSQSWLVIADSTPINVRRITPSNGTADRFAIDQLVNLDSVTLTPGGIWRDAIVLNGRVSTASTTVRSQELMKHFQPAFRRHFKKIKAFGSARKRVCGSRQESG